MASSSTSTNSTFITGGLILIVGAFLLTYTQFLPQLKKARSDYKRSVAEEKGLRQDIVNLEQAEDFLVQKKAELQGRGVSIDIADQVIPPTEEVPNLYIQLETLMTNNPGLTEATYQLSAPSLDTTSGTVRVPITVSATGKYADLKTFMTRLETNVRPLVFTAIAFGQAAPTDGKPTAEGRLTLTATGYSMARNLSSLYSATAAQ